LLTHSDTGGIVTNSTLSLNILIPFRAALRFLGSGGEKLVAVALSGALASLRSTIKHPRRLEVFLLETPHDTKSSKE
jgi:hypothetical protein